MVGRLAIPSIGPWGNIYGLKFRKVREDQRGPKYLNSDGIGIRPFNTRALLEATTRIAICEGELDAITLEQCGIPAVGISGVEHWHKRYARMFVGFSEVLVVGDNDEAGQGARFSALVAKDVYAGRRVVLEEEGADINSIYVAGGAEALYSALGIPTV